MLTKQIVFNNVANLSQDHYSVHGENALFIATTFYKTLAVVKHIGGTENGLPGKGFQALVAQQFTSLRAYCIRRQKIQMQFKLPLRSWRSDNICLSLTSCYFLCVF